jgi:hypothetical protein
MRLPSDYFFLIALILFAGICTFFLLMIQFMLQPPHPSIARKAYMLCAVRAHKRIKPFPSSATNTIHFLLHLLRNLVVLELQESIYTGALCVVCAEKDTQAGIYTYTHIFIHELSAVTLETA